MNFNNIPMGLRVPLFFGEISINGNAPAGGGTVPQPPLISCADATNVFSIVRSYPNENPTIPMTEEIVLWNGSTDQGSFGFEWLGTDTIDIPDGYDYRDNYRYIGDVPLRYEIKQLPENQDQYRMKFSGQNPTIIQFGDNHYGVCLIADTNVISCDGATDHINFPFRTNCEIYIDGEFAGVQWYSASMWAGYGLELSPQADNWIMLKNLNSENVRVKIVVTGEPDYGIPEDNPTFHDDNGTLTFCLAPLEDISQDIFFYEFPRDYPAFTDEIENWIAPTRNDFLNSCDQTVENTSDSQTDVNIIYRGVTPPFVYDGDLRAPGAPQFSDVVKLYKPQPGGILLSENLYQRLKSGDSLPVMRLVNDGIAEDVIFTGESFIDTELNKIGDKYLLPVQVINDSTSQWLDIPLITKTLVTVFSNDGETVKSSFTLNVNESFDFEIYAHEVQLGSGITINLSNVIGQIPEVIPVTMAINPIDKDKAEINGANFWTSYGAIDLINRPDLNTVQGPVLSSPIRPLNLTRVNATTFTLNWNESAGQFERSSDYKVSVLFPNIKCNFNILQGYPYGIGISGNCASIHIFVPKSE